MPDIDRLREIDDNRIHAERYEPELCAHLPMIENDYEPETFFMCPFCGLEEVATPTEMCNVCGSPEAIQERAEFEAWLKAESEAA